MYSYSTTLIKKLLEKYFDGNTSIAEEQILKSYFNEHEVASELLPYQSLFQYFTTTATIQSSDDLERKIVAQLPTATIRRIPSTWMRWTIGIAASIAMLVAGWWVADQWQTEEQVAVINWEQYEPDNPEEAYEYTKAALELLAKKLNGGAAQVAEELDKLNEVSSIFKD